MKNTISILIPFDSIEEFELRQKKLFRETLKELLDESVKKPDDGIKLLSRQEVAKLLHISLPTLNGLTKSGILKCKRINRRVLYDLDDVLGALKSVDPVTSKPAQ